MKIRKIIICLLLLLLINAIFLVPNVHAISEIKDSADSFLGSAEDSKAKINDNLLKETSSSIYNILLGIGIAASVIVGAFLGIKFIMESPEGKAKVSETLVPYIVGCVVVFGAFTIWKMAINMGNSLTEPAVTHTQKIGYEIYEGNIDPEDLSENELKTQYSGQQISSELYTLMYGDSRNPSEPRNGTKYRSLNEAVNSLSEYKQKIYNACKSKNLLKTDGYSLK